MSTFTPTASRTAIAGASLWALVWTMVGHIDTVIAPFGFRNKFLSRRIRRWVNRNKGLTICITEIVNLSHAGLNPLGTTFAIGGTVLTSFISSVSIRLSAGGLENRTCCINSTRRM